MKSGSPVLKKASSAETAELVELMAEFYAESANTRQIRYVVLDGDAYTPADLLEGSGSSQRKDR